MSDKQEASEPEKRYRLFFLSGGPVPDGARNLYEQSLQIGPDAAVRDHLDLQDKDRKLQVIQFFFLAGKAVEERAKKFEVTGWNWQAALNTKLQAAGISPDRFSDSQWPPETVSMFRQGIYPIPDEADYYADILRYLPVADDFMREELNSSRLQIRLDDKNRMDAMDWLDQQGLLAGYPSCDLSGR